MRLRKVRRTFGVEINMTPMIDIVFQLVIFFMLVSQVTRVEAENLSLPEAQKANTPDQPPVGQLVINVTRDRRYIVSGQSHVMAGIEAILAGEVAARPASQVSVLVRGDRDTPWEAVARALQACATKQIVNVRVAVLKPENTGRSS
jgi:biopolymer transport protein ExbD